MSSNLLTKEEQNFIRFAKARDDVMPLPLRDILDWQIKPKDLHKKIQSCSALNNGEKKLDSHQLNQTKLADYNIFDVSLLYKLIRNLCPGLNPTNGWGMKLNFNDTTIGDDIERIRVFRNDLGHSKSSNISNSEFTNRWAELKIVIDRLQKAMSTNGYNTDYKEKLRAIEELDFGNEPREKYKTSLVLDYAYDCLQQLNDRDEPTVSITGNENAIWGENVAFKAIVTNTDSSCWSLTWQKTRENVTETININRDKYLGSNDRKLVITSVSQEDMWIYQAVLSRNGSEKKQKIFSNDILLKILGDIPKAEISTESNSYYASCVSISSEVVSCPALDGARWQKSGDGINFDSIDITKAKYHKSCLDPKSPSLAIEPISFVDKQHYRLCVWNKIGENVSNTVYLNVIGSRPNVTIFHKTCIKNHSVTLTGSVFLYEECLEVHDLFWTKNGQKLDSYKIGGKYLKEGMDDPSLTIFDVNQQDAGSYQLIATNAVGTTQSNVIVLGNPDVFLEKSVKMEDGSWCFTMTIKSIPSPCFVQWRLKEANDDSFKILDVNSEDYGGTLNTLPNPVLVIRQSEQLQTHCFQIEVQNFIDNCKKILQASDIFSEPTTEDSKKHHNLSNLYNDRGASIMFGRLFDEIVESFPKGQTPRLGDLIRYSCKVEDKESIMQAISARDCFKVLTKESLFTPEDVIFVQYLLKTTNCEQLYKRCYEYAISKKALCFYEMPTGKGFNKVRFHVKANLQDYTIEQIEIIKDTVAASLGCTSDDISVIGYEHSTSFYVVLSIRQVFIKKLIAIEEHVKEKFFNLNIDYLIVDIITVYIRCPIGLKKEETYLDVASDESLIMRKEHPHSSAVILDPEKQQSRSGLSKLSTKSFQSPEKAYGLKEKGMIHIETSLTGQTKYTAIHTASIILPLKGLMHVSCLKLDRLWVSTFNDIYEIDKTGNILKKLDVNMVRDGYHTVSKDGDLLFLNKNCIYKLDIRGDLDILCSASVTFRCIYSSRINGDVLVGLINRIIRYSKTGCIIHEIPIDNVINGTVCPSYITENINGDIIVSDYSSRNVVAIDKSGQKRFTYRDDCSEPSFQPKGICTDVLGNILVCNITLGGSVYLLDVDGHFLSYLLTYHDSKLSSLCVDDKHNLYVEVNNSIEVYSYLTEALLEKRDMQCVSNISGFRTFLKDALPLK